MAKGKNNPQIVEASVDWLKVGQELAANTCCFEVHMRSFGFRKKIDANELLNEKDRQKEEQVSASAVAASKMLIEKTMLAQITKADNKFRTWIRSRAVYSTIVGDGMYLLPSALIEEVDAALAAFIAERQELVEAFIAEYPNLKDAQRLKLGRLYKESDYPTIEEIRSGFAVESRYVTLSVPEQLAVFSEQIFAREREKMERQWQTAFGEIREAMRAGFLDLVNHMVDRLGNDADGKPRIFRDSLVENLADFLGTFQARNLTDDDQLAALVEEARGYLKGVTPKRIRESKSFRSNMAKSFNGIKERLDTMVTTRSRQFRFDGKV